MEDGVASGVASVLEFIFTVLVWNIVLLNIGRVMLLVLTVGRYPRGSQLVAHANRISWVGVGVLAAAWIAIAAYNRLPGA